MANVARNFSSSLFFSWRVLVVVRYILQLFPVSSHGGISELLSHFSLFFLAATSNHYFSRNYYTYTGSTQKQNFPKTILSFRITFPVVTIASTSGCFLACTTTQQTEERKMFRRPNRGKTEIQRKRKSRRNASTNQLTNSFNQNCCCCCCCKLCTACSPRRGTI